MLFLTKTNVWWCNRSLVLYRKIINFTECECVVSLFGTHILRSRINRSIKYIVTIFIADLCGQGDF